MPPRFGKLDLASWGKSAPTINGYKTEPWTLKGAKVLTINMEIDDDPADNLLPATMHPSIPEYAIFCVTTYPESPVGAFSIAEVRVSGRTGVRPRGAHRKDIIVARQRQRTGAEHEDRCKRNLGLGQHVSIS